MDNQIQVNNSQTPIQDNDLDTKHGIMLNSENKDNSKEKVNDDALTAEKAVPKYKTIGKDISDTDYDIPRPIHYFGRQNNSSLSNTSKNDNDDLDYDIPKETSINQDPDYDVPRGALANQNSDYDIPREALASRNSDYDIPREALASRNSDYDIPRETLASRNSDYDIPREALASRNSDYDIPREALATQNSDYDIPRKVLESQNSDYDIPREALASQNSDYDIPREVLKNRETDYDIPKTYTKKEYNESKYDPIVEDPDYDQPRNFPMSHHAKYDQPRNYNLNKMKDFLENANASTYDVPVNLQRKPSRIRDHSKNVPRKKIHCQAVAVFKNESETYHELSFKAGALIDVIEINTLGLEGWWLCEYNGKRGVCPGNRLRLINPSMSTMHLNRCIVEKSEEGQDNDNQVILRRGHSQKETGPLLGYSSLPRKSRKRNDIYSPPQNMRRYSLEQENTAGGIYDTVDHATLVKTVSQKDTDYDELIPVYGLELEQLSSKLVLDFDNKKSTDFNEAELEEKEREFLQAVQGLELICISENKELEKDDLNMTVFKLKESIETILNQLEKYINSAVSLGNDVLASSLNTILPPVKEARDTASDTWINIKYGSWNMNKTDSKENMKNLLNTTIIVTDNLKKISQLINEQGNNLFKQNQPKDNESKAPDDIKDNFHRSTKIDRAMFQFYKQPISELLADIKQEIATYKSIMNSVNVELKPAIEILKKIIAKTYKLLLIYDSVKRHLTKSKLADWTEKLSKVEDIDKQINAIINNASMLVAVVSDRITFIEFEQKIETPLALITEYGQQLLDYSCSEYETAN